MWALGLSITWDVFASLLCCRYGFEFAGNGNNRCLSCVLILSIWIVYFLSYTFQILERAILFIHRFACTSCTQFHFPPLHTNVDFLFTPSVTLPVSDGHESEMPRMWGAADQTSHTVGFRGMGSCPGLFAKRSPENGPHLLVPWAYESI